MADFTFLERARIEKPIASVLDRRRETIYTGRADVNIPAVILYTAIAFGVMLAANLTSNYITYLSIKQEVQQQFEERQEELRERLRR